MAQACQLPSAIRRLDLTTQPSVRRTNSYVSSLPSRRQRGFACANNNSLLQAAPITASSNRGKRVLSQRRAVDVGARITSEDLGIELCTRKAELERGFQASEETNITLETLPEARVPQVLHHSSSLIENNSPLSSSNDSPSVVAAPVSSEKAGWGIFEPLRRIVQLTEEKFTPRARGLFLLNVLTFLYGK